MGRDRWLGRALLLFLIAAAIWGTASPALAQPLGVVFLRPTGGATISDPSGVAIAVESFGGSDPDGNAIVERRFVFAVNGTTVSDTTGTFPVNHQEGGFFWSLAGVSAGPHVIEVTVFDEAGASATSAITVNVAGGTAQPVAWTSLVNTVAVGNTLTKSAGCDGCAAGAVSQQVISPVNGGVTFTVSPNAYLTVGLGAGNPGTGAAEIAFGLRFYPGNLVEVRESGVYKADWTYAAGATHAIAVDAGVVKYLLNGAVKYESTVAPAFPLVVDTSVWTLGAAVQDAVVTTGGGTPAPTGPGPVVWTNPVNATVSGATVTKSGGCDGCFDAGAVSQQLITTGSGSVTFATPPGAFLVAGFSNGNPGTSGNEIAFGLRFYPGSPGIVEVRESGAYKWDWLNVQGATHTIALEAGVVKYYQNDTLKYTSAVAPSLPLLLDTALGSAGSAVLNATVQ
jgi:hypothetical protein